jgi:DNA-binding transcriptional LysR family regulator
MLPPLYDMALFVEVVKAKGFLRAAQALGMPSSTLSRRIGQLEKAIGLRLFNRTTRRVELTEAGRVYFEQCERIVEEARLAHQKLEDIVAYPTGVLRVSLPVDFANIFLTELLAEFAHDFPGITFDLDLTPRRVDLVAEPFDVAIRMGEPEDSRLIARLLTRLEPRLFASTDYLARHEAPLRPQDLTAHDCLHMPRARLWRLNDGQDNVDVNVTGRYALNSNSMIRGLAMLGQGVALIPQQLVAEQVAAGQLVRILPEWQGAPIPVYAITETRLLPARIQRFVEFLQTRLREQEARASTSPPTA